MLSNIIGIQVDGIASYVLLVTTATQLTLSNTKQIFKGNPLLEYYYSTVEMQLQPVTHVVVVKDLLLCIADKRNYT